VNRWIWPATVLIVKYLRSFPQDRERSRDRFTFALKVDALRWLPAAAGVPNSHQAGTHTNANTSTTTCKLRRHKNTRYRHSEPQVDRNI